MNKYGHDPARGVHGEKVQHREFSRRHRRPGTIVHVETIVTVEYNNYDGCGPYEVDYNLDDVERSFLPYCDATIEVDGDKVTCEGWRDYRGDCPRKQHHVEKKK